jgi:hypothetical protein
MDGMAALVAKGEPFGFVELNALEIRVWRGRADSISSKAGGVINTNPATRR